MNAEDPAAKMLALLDARSGGEAFRRQLLQADDGELRAQLQALENLSRRGRQVREARDAASAESQTASQARQQRRADLLKNMEVAVSAAAGAQAGAGKTTSRAQPVVADEGARVAVAMASVTPTNPATDAGRPSTGMVVIRLARGGMKKRPFYNIVVADSGQRRDGRFIERLGFYNPGTANLDESLRVSMDRLSYWFKAGATPSPTVVKLINQFTHSPAARSGVAKKGDLGSRDWASGHGLKVG